MFVSIAAWFTSKWASILPWLLAAGGIIIGAFSIRQSGENAVKQQIDVQNLKLTQGALHVQEAITTMSDTDVADKLRRYYRD